MSPRAVARLVRKDCSLMKAPLAAYVAAALGGLLLTACVGGPVGRSAGVTLAVNVLIGVSFHVMLGPVLGERERRTLAFVMSLPVTPAEVAVAKLASAFALFLLPATIAATHCGPTCSARSATTPWCSAPGRCCSRWCWRRRS